MMFVLYIYFSSLFQVEQSFYFAFVVFFQLAFHINKNIYIVLDIKTLNFRTGKTLRIQSLCFYR